jgi:hypothetical protein
LVAEGKVRVSQHGREELADDGISLADAIAGVAGAVVVEDYPDDAKGPSALCLQEDLQGDRIHVLWASREMRQTWQRSSRLIGPTRRAGTTI